MNRRVVAVVVAVLLAAGVVGFTHAVQQELDTDPEPLVQDGEEFDTTVFRITVLDNGDARWTLEQQRRIPIDDQESINQFQNFSERFLTTDTAAFENFRLRADRLTSQGSGITDREMRASNFTRDAFYRDTQQRGIVRMSFLWHGFAPVEGDRVTVADVLQGFSIFEDQRLEIVAGGNLTVESRSPDPDRSTTGSDVDTASLIWQGPESFTDPPLEVALTPESTSADSPDDSPDNGGATGDQPSDDNATTGGGDGAGPADGEGGSPEDGDEDSAGDSTMLMPVLVAMVLVLGAGGGAVWYTVTRTESDEPEPEATEAPPSPTVEQSSVSETDLLSDEDLVIQLLEENGGRMRQVSIVEETDWSKSKVSMLLSDMEDDGDISKLRVGRENIISLSGEEPEAAGSPFEEETD